MLLDVINIKKLDDYVLELTFENDEIRFFDCKQLFDKKPYAMLQDKSFFNRAKIEFGTVSWSEDIDVAPESLYLNSNSTFKN